MKKHYALIFSLITLVFICYASFLQAQFDPKGITVAGGNGYGAAPNQLAHPQAIFVSKRGVVYVVDNENHRVMLWRPDSTAGRVVAGGNGQVQPLTS